jgi:hypothetical protein
MNPQLIPQILVTAYTKDLESLKLSLFIPSTKQNKDKHSGNMTRVFFVFLR